MDEGVVEELIGDGSEQCSSAREEEMEELLSFGWRGRGRFGYGGEDGDILAYDGLVMTMMAMDGDILGGDGEEDVAGDGKDDDEGGGRGDEGDVAAVVGGDGEGIQG